MTGQEITTFAEAQEELQLKYPTTVTDLVEKARITPKPVPRCGTAKGLDRDDMRKLRRMLGMKPSRSTATA